MSQSRTDAISAPGSGVRAKVAGANASKVAIARARSAIPRDGTGRRPELEQVEVDPMVFALHGLQTKRLAGVGRTAPAAGRGRTDVSGVGAKRHRPVIGEGSDQQKAGGVRSRSMPGPHGSGCLGGIRRLGQVLHAHNRNGRQEPQSGYGQHAADIRAQVPSAAM